MTPLSPEGLIFDFDGVLIESEYIGNRQIAEWLTSIGHPTTPEEAMAHFMGLAGDGLMGALENWIGRPVPDSFGEARRAEDRRVMEEGIEAVRGAIEFVRDLPPELPRAIASSSSVGWIERHVERLGLREHFAPHIYSGREHVARGKPAPDLYLYAADRLGVPIERIVIIEDSPVGVTGALASGAEVIGLCVASHCLPGHDERLRELGVRHIAHDFDEIRAQLGLENAGQQEMRAD